MDYYTAAFGEYEPHRDPHAAVKFALNVLFMDQRFEDLSQLLDPQNELSGVGGEPGWIIERVASSSSDGSEQAKYRASVDPESFSLGHPETYLNEGEFFRYLLCIIDAMKRTDPSCAETHSAVLLQLKRATAQY